MIVGALIDAAGFALFGLFAGDGVEHVVSGLHLSALTAIVMLGVAAVIAVFGIHASRQPEQG